ncbi:MAG: hypothetical protein JWN34_1962 [Bryobacterales bacterium]|nr:hypothetical protein [Bryobacterales bacterium]
MTFCSWPELLSLAAGRVFCGHVLQSRSRRKAPSLPPAPKCKEQAGVWSSLLLRSLHLGAWYGTWRLDAPHECGVSVTTGVGSILRRTMRKTSTLLMVAT